MSDVEIVTVDAGNVAELGFFCYKSKRKTEGYRDKLRWLQKRFAEGLRIHIVYERGHQVGFIEYVPGDFAWRAVHAPDYLVIHCLWVIGRSKGKGFGSRLVDMCLEEAQRMGRHGVAVVASSRPWLPRPELFLRKGFERVDRAPPAFELLAQRLGDFPLPRFPQDWEQRLVRYGPGLTVVRSGQCPYLYAAARAALEAAQELGLTACIVELKDCREAQDLAPSAYGVFNLVYNGKLLAYRPLGKNDVRELLERER
jgi:ribosomal protein S18 acetylase RimI-like enzyme